MKIIQLNKRELSYSCNSYLLLGDWNRIEDVNTVIDPGIDGFIIDEIEHRSTGFGKVAVEQIILTHNHFDHAGGVLPLKQRFGARVMAFLDGPGVDELLYDGHIFKAGDGVIEVIHTPVHSSDSICLYVPSAKALFSGDMQLQVRGDGGSHPRTFVDALAKLAGRDIRKIYSGHDDPVIKGGHEMIVNSLSRVNSGPISSADRWG